MMVYAWWCLWSILSTYLHIFIQDIHILLPITLLDWNPFRKSEILKLIIVDDYYSNFCKFLLEMVFGMFCTSCKSSIFLCLHFLRLIYYFMKNLVSHPFFMSASCIKNYHYKLQRISSFLKTDKKFFGPNFIKFFQTRIDFWPFRRMIWRI